MLGGGWGGGGGGWRFCPSIFYFLLVHVYLELKSGVLCSRSHLQRPHEREDVAPVAWAAASMGFLHKEDGIRVVKGLEG